MRKASIIAALAVTTVASSLSSPAQADGVPADRCAATYPERIAAVQAALVRWQAWRAERAMHAAALTWFDANCRFLTQLERAARRENDLDAFVCRTKKGRPKGLTAELVQQYATDMAPGTFVEGPASESMLCVERDAAERLSLALPADLTPGEQLELMCWGRDTPSCAAGLAALEQARTAGKAAPSRLRRAP